MVRNNKNFRAILSDKFYPYVPKERILISYDPSGKGDQEEFDSW
jgi:hypothetical protein